MKIKTRLYISAGISIILVMTLVSVVFITSNEIAEKNKEHGIAHNLHLAISELDIITYDYLMHREERMEQQWNLKYNSVAKILRKAKKEKTEFIRADYFDLGKIFLQVTRNYQKTQNLIQVGASQKKIDATIALEERLVTQLLITSQSIMTDISRLAEKLHIEVIEAQKLANTLTLILMLVLAIFVTTTTFLVARSISKPLTKLTKGTGIIGKGNLKHKIDIKSKDEIGELATSFNIMTKNLHDISVSKDELENEVTERKRAEEKLLSVNKQLENANQELEAFCYSISHDLRAPLRAIDGFSKILMEDYTDILDEEGKRLLNVVINNTQRMANLIDDLLSFSHLGRKEMKTSGIDMTKLVKGVIKGLKVDIPEREIDWKINTLCSAKGDNSLVRQVWVNLLSNAIKFTRSKDKAKIEVGYNSENNEIVYYVKDNGVGFDKKYVDKLFNVFQRLHSVEEFEGTGVGLAIVKRIVQRHSGRVWAEGKVNRGATFYFMIPNQQ